MHAEVRQVQEKRTITFPADEFHSAVCEEVGEVLTFRIFGWWIGFEIVVCSHGDQGFSESSSGRVMCIFLTEVPFTEHSRIVSGILQNVGNGSHGQRQLGDVADRFQRARLPVEAVCSADCVNSCSRTILAGHQGCSSGLAVWSAGVTVSESQSL